MYICKFLKVTWSHATNSMACLALAMTSSIMMIEADVSLGKQITYLYLLNFETYIRAILFSPFHSFTISI